MQGGKIGAAIQKQLIYIFRSKLEEGQFTCCQILMCVQMMKYYIIKHPFKLSFEKNTIIIKQHISQSIICVHPLTEVFRGDFDLTF